MIEENFKCKIRQINHLPYSAVTPKLKSERASKTLELTIRLHDS